MIVGEGLGGGGGRGINRMMGDERGRLVFARLFFFGDDLMLFLYFVTLAYSINYRLRPKVPYLTSYISTLLPWRRALCSFVS